MTDTSNSTPSAASDQPLAAWLRKTVELAHAKDKQRLPDEKGDELRRMAREEHGYSFVDIPRHPFASIPLDALPKTDAEAARFINDLPVLDYPPDVRKRMNEAALPRMSPEQVAETSASALPVLEQRLSTRVATLRSDMLFLLRLPVDLLEYIGNLLLAAPELLTRALTYQPTPEASALRQAELERAQAEQQHTKELATGAGQVFRALFPNLPRKLLQLPVNALRLTALVSLWLPVTALVTFWAGVALALRAIGVGAITVPQRVGNLVEVVMRMYNRLNEMLDEMLQEKPSEAIKIAYQLQKLNPAGHLSSVDPMKYFELELEREGEFVKKLSLMHVSDSTQGHRMQSHFFLPNMTAEEACRWLNIDFERYLVEHGSAAFQSELEMITKRLMTANHPDKGGAPFLAVKYGEAKDVLLLGTAEVHDRKERLTNMMERVEKDEMFDSLDEFDNDDADPDFMEQEDIEKQHEFRNPFFSKKNPGFVSDIFDFDEDNPGADEDDELYYQWMSRPPLGHDSWRAKWIGDAFQEESAYSWEDFGLESDAPLLVAPSTMESDEGWRLIEDFRDNETADEHTVRRRIPQYKLLSGIYSDRSYDDWIIQPTIHEAMIEQHPMQPPDPAAYRRKKQRNLWFWVPGEHPDRIRRGEELIQEAHWRLWRLRNNIPLTSYWIDKRIEEARQVYREALNEHMPRLDKPSVYSVWLAKKAPVSVVDELEDLDAKDEEELSNLLYKRRLQFEKKLRAEGIPYEPSDYDEWEDRMRGKEERERLAREAADEEDAEDKENAERKERKPKRKKGSEEQEEEGEGGKKTREGESLGAEDEEEEHDSDKGGGKSKGRREYIPPPPPLDEELPKDRSARREMKDGLRDSPFGRMPRKLGKSRISDETAKDLADEMEAEEDGRYTIRTMAPRPMVFRAWLYQFTYTMKKMEAARVSDLLSDYQPKFMLENPKWGSYFYAWGLYPYRVARNMLGLPSETPIIRWTPLVEAYLPYRREGLTYRHHYMMSKRGVSIPSSWRSPKFRL